MQIIRSVGFALIILASACASTPGDRGSRETTKKLLRGGIAEFRIASYDGDTIKGRVLLGATIDPLPIDNRLVESGDVELVNLQSCGKKDWVPHVIFDAVASPPRPDELITVRPGYWYGKNISYWLFIEKKTGLGPDCLEAELVVRVLDGREAARLPIRVVRTDKPPTPPDGGAPAAPKLPPSDAGAP